MTERTLNEFYDLNEQLEKRVNKIVRILEQQSKDLDALYDYILDIMHNRCGEDPAEENASAVSSAQYDISKVIGELQGLSIYHRPAHYDPTETYEV